MRFSKFQIIISRCRYLHIERIQIKNKHKSVYRKSNCVFKYLNKKLKTLSKEIISLKKKYYKNKIAAV